MEISGRIGKFNILRKLGSGGFGTVYLAEDAGSKTVDGSVLIALKIPHRIGVDLDKLKQEFILQYKLNNHPNIVKLHSFDNIEGNIVLVMEYIKGKDLEQMIDDCGPLEINKSMRYFKQLLSAVNFAHQHRIIHRDIRPSNVLIDSYDNVKITDFGTSKLLGDKPFATTRIGSPPYMAPEQFQGKAVFASDIYSCGVLFYEMVSGFPPIVSANPMEIFKKAKEGDIIPLIRQVPKIKKEFNWIIMKSLAPNLDDRYHTIDEMLNDINIYEKTKVNKKSEISTIKERISARNNRVDTSCWNCRKSIPVGNNKCPYCGVEI